MPVSNPSEVVSGKSRKGSYLVNIYHAEDRGKSVLGTVEKLGNENQEAFHSIQELLNLLGLDNTASEKS